MAPPKGSKYAIGNKGPSKRYTSVEQLQEAIDAYFEKCDTRTIDVVDNHGDVKTVNKPEPYTVEGLCIALGFSTRESLLHYEKEPGYDMYFDTIKRAKLKIQQNKVVGALDGTYHANFTMFDLKNNHRYKDKTEIEQTNVNIDADSKSIAEIKNTIRELLCDE